MQAETKKERKLVRVRKEEVIVDRTEKPDNFRYCLDCWAIWMGIDADRGLGAQIMRLPAGAGDAYGTDPQEADYRHHLEVGEATGAMVDSLSAIHRWAIYKMCGLASVWNFPHADLLIIGPTAQESLREKLRRNILTAVLF